MTDSTTPQQALEDELKKETVPVPQAAAKENAPAAPAPRRRGRPRKTEAEKKASAAKRATDPMDAFTRTR